ncbi:Uridine 5'-monophosphate synthase-like protein, partial [Daphnia magna]
CPQEAQGLRPRRPDRGRADRGRARPAGGGPGDRWRQQAPLRRGAAQGRRRMRAYLRRLPLRHLPRERGQPEGRGCRPARALHLVGRAGDGRGRRLLPARNHPRGAGVPGEAGGVVARPRRQAVTVQPA